LWIWLGWIPNSLAQLGDRPIALDCRHRHLGLEPCTVLLPCPLYVPLLRYLRWTPIVRQPEPLFKV